MLATTKTNSYTDSEPNTTITTTGNAGTNADVQIPTSEEDLSFIREISEEEEDLATEFVIPYERNIRPKLEQMSESGMKIKF